MTERLKPSFEVIEGNKGAKMLSQEKPDPLEKAIDFFNQNRSLVEQASPDEIIDVQHMIEHRIARNPGILAPLVDTGFDTFLMEDHSDLPSGA